MDMPTRFGTATPEQLAGLTGIQMLEQLMAGELPAPTMGRTLNFKLSKVAPGYALFEGETTPELLNPLGGVHGGWALALIDSACGCAVHTTLPAGTGYATLETKANMTRPIRADTGLVRCEGRVVAAGKQVSTAEAKLTDAEGRILAHGTSTLMLLAPRPS